MCGEKNASSNLTRGTNNQQVYFANTTMHNHLINKVKNIHIGILLGYRSYRDLHVAFDKSLLLQICSLMQLTTVCWGGTDDDDFIEWQCGR